MFDALTLPRPSDGLRRAAVRARAGAAAVWRSHPRETVGIGLLAFVSAVTGATIATGGFASRAEAAPPAPPPLILRDIPANQAVKVNAELPVAEGPNPAAAPFRFNGDAATRAQALECLASAIYYEAGNQEADGARAVAQVVLNRVRHPAFPANVCGVVYEGSTRVTGCQFTFTCDGSLNRQPDAEGWRRAWKVAEAALGGQVYTPVGWATHYHANYVVPYWASSLAKNAVVGLHIFYRWGGRWGRPAAFAGAYVGAEPNARALRTAALSVARPVLAVRENQVAAAVKEIPGAEPLKLAPSMRGDERVAVRFHLAAREASDKAVRGDYAQTFAASENLKWALSSEASASDEKPLGRAAASETAAPAAASAGR